MISLSQHTSTRIALPPHLPLSDQLPLQVVDLEEGATGVDGADGPDGPDCPYRPPGRPGEILDFLSHPVPETTAPVEIATAHGEGLIQTAVQRGCPDCLQVRVRFGSERHLKAGSRSCTSPSLR